METAFDDRKQYQITIATDQLGAGTLFMKQSCCLEPLPGIAFCNERVISYPSWSDFWPLGYWKIKHITGTWLFQCPTLDAGHQMNALVRAALNHSRTLNFGKIPCDCSGFLDEGLPPSAISRKDIQDQRRHALLLSYLLPPDGPYENLKEKKKPEVGVEAGGAPQPSGVAA